MAKNHSYRIFAPRVLKLCSLKVKSSKFNNKENR